MSAFIVKTRNDNLHWSIFTNLGQEKVNTFTTSTQKCQLPECSPITNCQNLTSMQCFNPELIKILISTSKTQLLSKSFTSYIYVFCGVHAQEHMHVCRIPEKSGTKGKILNLYFYFTVFPPPT